MSAPPAPPQVRYRMQERGGKWSIYWLCGRFWFLVAEPASEAAAKQWLVARAAEIL